MGEAVDASAVLALLLRESHDLTSVVDELDRAVVSAVNIIEVRTKLIDLEKLSASALEDALSLVGQVEPLTEKQAVIAAELRRTTRFFGLSLGDRACLALALDLKLDVFTADRAWSQLQVSCRIHQVR